VTKKVSRKSSEDENKEVIGKTYLFASRENKRINLLNKCFDVYAYNALKLTYEHL